MKKGGRVARSQARRHRSRICRAAGRRRLRPRRARRSSASTSTPRASPSSKPAATARARSSRTISATLTCASRPIPRELSDADFFIVTVPTPIDEARRPDLTALLRASRTVGQALKKGDIVVYELTVYPGATEEDCVPILEQASGLAAGSDFTVGYSPERINPGDKAHRFETIKKVVAGQDARTLDIIAAVYGSVVTAGLHKAPSIKVAEAAKVIENAQRDLNIAFMNELSAIFHQLGIDTKDVLAAAATKWNFLNFTPGLVGGHCIGVDPYYLTYPGGEGRLSSRRDPRRPAHQRLHRRAGGARMPAPPLEGRRARRARDRAGTDVQGERRRYPQFAGGRHHSRVAVLRPGRAGSRSLRRSGGRGSRNMASPCSRTSRPPTRSCWRSRMSPIEPWAGR